MKIKKEQIILAVICLALILYLVLRKQDRTHYQLPEVPKIPQTEITRIEISNPDSSIVMKKRDGDWHIDPQKYLANSAYVKRMLDFIEKPRFPRATFNIYTSNCS